MVLLKTSDNLLFEFDTKYIKKCELLRSIWENTIVIEPVPLLLKHEILEIIYGFCKQDNCILSPDFNPYEIRFKQTDLDYFSQYDCNTLIELSNGCSYLEYYYGLEVCCKLIAGKLRNKKVDVLRKQLGDEGECEKVDFEWLSSDE